MEKKFYLVTTLIEYSAESITDAHALYEDYEKAKEAMAVEIENAAENFGDQEGETIVDVETLAIAPGCLTSRHKRRRLLQ